jgi:hypothetical protein
VPVSFVLLGEGRHLSGLVVVGTWTGKVFRIRDPFGRPVHRAVFPGFAGYPWFLLHCFDDFADLLLRLLFLTPVAYYSAYTVDRNKVKSNKEKSNKNKKSGTIKKLKDTFNDIFPHHAPPFPKSMKG